MVKFIFFFYNRGHIFAVLASGSFISVNVSLTISVVALLGWVQNKPYRDYGLAVNVLETTQCNGPPQEGSGRVNTKLV